MTSTTLITLDYTLRDLYAIDNEGEPIPTLIYDTQPTENCGKTSSGKFTYHTCLQSGETTTDASKALFFKCLVQRRAFLSGSMPVIILNITSEQKRPDKSVYQDQLDMYRNFAQLRLDQQPTASFAENADHIALHQKTPLVVARPTDYVSHLPSVVEPEMHYELLSKRGLARSGLPTPPSLVIDPLLLVDHLRDPAGLQHEIERITNHLDIHRIPFVVKLPQSLSGHGTFTVLSEAERKQVKAVFGARIRKMLEGINASNYHLHPSSVVLQDYIQGPEMALSLFVTRMGRPIFISCCKQRFDEQGHWVGGSISYAQQSSLHQTYAKTIEKVAQFLHKKGYYGAAGVDVITDSLGKHYVVDLNARITGTYQLGLLSEHFVQRGLETAKLMAGYFPYPRTTFEKAFCREIQDGSLVITGWAHDDSMQLSYGAITAGGRKFSDTDGLLARVRAHTLSLSA
ncbi:uncharacterized protein BP5553_06390 [Venustampulla echinocandica]|uniref:ATP-grasp domain-containing protein n=1 Tax=Venustampulla echinocandica TaxID=2656787 RepID=A0A370TJS4_9HELO|nr:uncharacterized protein BP5553_06390 [Venustampulla echinocandica]RDL35778.1 hypothetical protein BP5553_06390 [Venustampulla echinocandica]